MTDRATLTLLADGGIIIGFPQGTPQDRAHAIRSAIEEYVRADHEDGVGLSIPIPIDIDDQRLISAPPEDLA